MRRTGHLGAITKLLFLSQEMCAVTHLEITFGRPPLGYFPYHRTVIPIALIQKLKKKKMLACRFELSSRDWHTKIAETNTYRTLSARHSASCIYVNSPFSPAK